jgi:RNA polymerase sigma factor (sigma-70 family)
LAETVMQDCRADIELARQAASGEQKSWRQIYDATCDRLSSILFCLVGNRDEALDLLQETYLQAFRHIDRYRGEAPLEVWLRVIAIRKALDWRKTVLRRIKRTVRLTEAIAAVDADPRTTGAGSVSMPLMAALGKLSPSQKAALILREFEGASFSEIAGALGCKESTARVHHAKARERMRLVLSKSSGNWKADGLEGQPT